MLPPFLKMKAVAGVFEYSIDLSAAEQLRQEGCVSQCSGKSHQRLPESLEQKLLLEREQPTANQPL